MFSEFIFFVLFCELRVGSLTQEGEPSRNGLTERTERSGKDFAAGADGNGRDRLLCIWRGCVLAQAASSHKSSSEQDTNCTSYVEAVTDEQSVAKIVARLRRECSRSLRNDGGLSSVPLQDIWA